ncbi:MAG TPA: hypothetical protein DDZ80_32050 [Cyanobacteria bacterium UBA8803]|nr:hypothetical protein [Cyanobacteria bacterium UBA9273]HBL62842.1 hypothetical protein [Cyanobacteria bacterium UBA8803]
MVDLYRFHAICNIIIDTTPQIAETLYFSLSGVDALLCNGLRGVFLTILERICYSFWSGVDLAAETLTG